MASSPAGKGWPVEFGSDIFYIEDFATAPGDDRRKSSMEIAQESIGLADLPGVVTRIVNETPIVDMHTHLYSEEFGEIGLWGVDELINYHYLVAELFRYSSL